MLNEDGSNAQPDSDTGCCKGGNTKDQGTLDSGMITLDFLTFSQVVLKGQGFVDNLYNKIFSTQRYSYMLVKSVPTLDPTAVEQATGLLAGGLQFLSDPNILGLGNLYLYQDQHDKDVSCCENCFSGNCCSQGSVRLKAAGTVAGLHMVTVVENSGSAPEQKHIDGLNLQYPRELSGYNLEPTNPASYPDAGTIFQVWHAHNEMKRNTGN